VQGNVVIKGRVANQYEYDRIVEFAEAHHHNMLGIRNSTASSIFGTGMTSGTFNAPGGANQNQGDVGVEFMLLPSTTASQWEDGSAMKKGPYHIQSPMHVSGIITEMRAGAQRFVNSPEFEIGLKVTRDHREQPYQDLRDVQEAMGRYVLGLGTAYKPEGLTEPNPEDDPLTPIDNLIDIGQGVVDGVTSVWDNVTDFLQ
jgi:hypothetical protein